MKTKVKNLDISTWRDYSKQRYNQNVNTDVLMFYERTCYTRLTGEYSKLQAQASVDIDGDTLTRCHIAIKPDGFWSDVITVTVSNFRGINISWSSGAHCLTTSGKPKDFHYDVGVICDIERADNMITGLRFAQQIARLYAEKYPGGEL